MIADRVLRILPAGQGMLATVGMQPIGPLMEQLRTVRPTDCFEVVNLDLIDPAMPLEATRATFVAIIGRTLTDLRRAVPLGILLPATEQVLVVACQPSGARRPGLPAISPRLQDVSIVEARQWSSGDWLVRVRFSRARKAGQVLEEVVNGLAPGAHGMVATVALAGRGAADWRPGDPTAVPIGESKASPDNGTAAGADLTLRVASTESQRWQSSRARVIERFGSDETQWERFAAPENRPLALVNACSDPHQVAPVDERTVNPSGFVSRPTRTHATLTQTRTCWSVQSADSNILNIFPTGAITDADVYALREFRSLHIDWGRHTGPLAAVRALAGLAAAGVPLAATKVPVWAKSLGPGLVELLTNVSNDELADDLQREEYSIKLRREAMRTHSSRARWRALATAAGVPIGSEPTISVLLCSSRPEYVEFALRQIALQRDVAAEVVLALHGASVTDARIRKALAEFDGEIVAVEVPRAATLGEVLNRAASVASGDFIAKWDDDDYYGPDHLADLEMAAHYSGADLVGCHNHFTYLEQIDLTVYRLGSGSEQYDSHVAGPTLMLRRDLLTSLGGFRPINRSEDTSLQTAVKAAGGRVYRMHGQGFLLYRRQKGHTWEVPVASFLRDTQCQWRGIRRGRLFDTGCGDALRGSSREGMASYR